MAKDMNNVNLIGRMVREEEIRSTTTGKKVITFTLAVNGNGEDTNFIECVAWDKTAELIAKFVKKGDRIAVFGSLNQESWEKDGQKRSKLNVIVREIQFLSAGKSGSAQQEPVISDKEPEIEEIDLSEIPF